MFFVINRLCFAETFFALVITLYYNALGGILSPSKTDRQPFSIVATRTRLASSPAGRAGRQGEIGPMQDVLMRSDLLAD